MRFHRCTERARPSTRPHFVPTWRFTMANTGCTRSKSGSLGVSICSGVRSRRRSPSRVIASADDSAQSSHFIQPEAFTHHAACRPQRPSRIRFRCDEGRSLVTCSRSGELSRAISAFLGFKSACGYQPWMTRPSVASAASWSDSCIVGCAWTVEMMSSAVASRRLANPISPISSLASSPKMCAPRISP